jgi:hypothetical protein
MKRFFHSLCILSLLLSTAMAAFGQSDGGAQGRRYRGPDDPPSDPQFEREGKMTGNRVMILFKNNTEISDFPRPDASRWPNTYYGNIMNDGIGLLIVSRVQLKNDTIPVDTWDKVAAAQAAGERIDTLYYCQTNYREEMDRDPTGTIEWGLHPVYGYMNINSETPALSNDPRSWPPQGWPATGKEIKWPGQWDGRFGMGVIYADLECYFVANDAQDQEYLGAEDTVQYQPRPDVARMGDLFPELSVQRDSPWGGLGIRVQQRGFQWNNPQARDAIFWEYTIANTTPYNLLEMGFGYWLDNDIGGNNANDDASFNKDLNMVYSWDMDKAGNGGYVSGDMGIAYLESPGISWDGVDNDNDGLVDEMRDNAVTGLVPAGFEFTKTGSDLTKFLDYNGMKDTDLREHWNADEDQDWVDGIDPNGDGKYELTDFAGDDLGLDGVGPGELQYPGPDEGEGNHKPDFKEGVGCEPNFNWTDINESDMLGLTTMMLYPIPDHVEPFRRWYRNDKSMWEVLTTDSLMSGASKIPNLGECFGTAIFPIYAGLTERISMSELHAYDDPVGLKSTDASAPILFNLKKVVQVIYEKDYRFAQPPKMPTLSATPGDGFVMLTWDNIADTRTREPLLSGKNDFEGYKVFRATDKKFSDPEVITDGEGTPMFKKAIFQCDIKDGRIGFTTYGLQNGMGYKLGDDTGITHSFIDNTVQNGRTYYYAIVAYDYGIHPDSLRWKMKSTSTSTNLNQDEKFGIAPSENNVVIELNDAEDVTFIGRNVAIVTPGPKAPGTEPALQDTTVNYNNAWGTGTVTPELMSANAVKKGHTYAVKFNTTRIDSLKNYTHALRYTTSGLSVWDVTKTDGRQNNILVYDDNLVLDPKSSTTTNVAYQSSNYHTVLAKVTAAVLLNTTSTSDPRSFWYIRPVTTADTALYTDLFDGIRLKVQVPTILAQYNPQKSGWVTGNQDTRINITTSATETGKLPWTYNIIFTSDTMAYDGANDGMKVITQQIIRDETGTVLRQPDILKGNFSFYVENMNFKDPEDTTKNERMRMVYQDLNKNKLFDILEDRVLVGAMDLNGRWLGTAFIVDFLNTASADELPGPDDVYQLNFDRPFYRTDSLTFTINTQLNTDPQALTGQMDLIKVVPNPYVATNVMEPAVANKQLNQRRRLMFTHIPEKCTIKIFTASGVLVDEIHAPEDGLVKVMTTNKQTGESEELGKYTTGEIHWDMLTREGLEIAAGVYIFHVKNEITNEEKIGKFAVIK